MEKDLKEFIEQPVTTRKRRKQCVLEVGQGVLFFLNPKELYNGVSLTIEDGELFDTTGYDGDLNSFDDLDAYYKERTDADAV